MNKWGETAAVVVGVAVVAIACLGMYITWRDCNDAGGTTVRGIFGLECIQR